MPCLGKRTDAVMTAKLVCYRLQTLQTNLYMDSEVSCHLILHARQLDMSNHAKAAHTCLSHMDRQ